MKSSLFFILIVSVIIITIYRVLKKSALKDKNYCNSYLGTHTMRKTGAYRVYTQSNYNIGLVMHLLNHSSESMTLTYLGLDQASRETMLDQIDFG